MSDLTQFAAHCRRMAERDSDVWWTILADEVDAYLASPLLPSDADHEALL